MSTGAHSGHLSARVKCADFNFSSAVKGLHSPWAAAPTCQDGPALALLLHATVLLARQREGRLKHKAVDVVMHFEIRLPVLYFLFLKEWCHIGHLDIGIFGVQILRVYL